MKRFAFLLVLFFIFFAAVTTAEDPVAADEVEPVAADAGADEGAGADEEEDIFDEGEAEGAEEEEEEAAPEPELPNLSYAGTAVTQLIGDDFFKTVVQSQQKWIVEFYAPWCGHCKSMKPHVIAATEALVGVARVGAVNADAASGRGLGRYYKVEGYPTFFVWDGTSQKPVKFQPRTEADIIKVGQDPSAASEFKVPDAPEKKAEDDKPFYTDTAVVEFEDEEDFNTQVLASDDVWIVEFYATWCGHCKNMKDKYIEAAEQLEGEAKLGASQGLDELAKKYKVKGYPTIYFFNKDKTDFHTVNAHDTETLVKIGKNPETAMEFHVAEKEEEPEAAEEKETADPNAPAPEGMDPVYGKDEL